MKRLIFCLLIYLQILFPVMAQAANCGGGTPCACGDTVTSSYTLAGDLSCTNAGNALNVGANDITIDLAGYTIDGDDTNVVVGIDNNGFTGITIQNGTITDTTTSGIDMYGAATGAISGVTCSSTGNQGFQNRNTANVTYSNIVANDNADDGFSMHDSAVAVINTASFTGNGQGINIINNANLTAYDVTIRTSTVNGVMTEQDSGSLTAYFERLDSTGGLVLGGNVTVHRSYIHDAAGSSGTNSIDTVQAATSNVTVTSSILENPGYRQTLARAGATLTLKNCTLYDADKNTIGSWIGGTLNMTNVIIHGAIQVFDLQVGATANLTNVCTYNYTTMWPTVEGTITNQVDADPVFVTNGTDYHLQGSSPCINKGAAVSGLTEDYTGVGFKGLPDIGAYEFPRNGAAIVGF